MSYYECVQCGWDDSCFPQVLVMLNSEIKHNNPDYYSKFDNEFENKFKEIVIEVAKENGISCQTLYQVSAGGYLKEVYDRYSRWLYNTQHQSFCSIQCAIDWLTEKEIERKEV